MMDQSIMTTKGQIVIPVKLRRKIGLKKGMKVFIEEKNGDIILHPVTPDFYEKFCGIFKGKNLVKELEKSRREDCAREEREIDRWKKTRGR